MSEREIVSADEGDNFGNDSEPLIVAAKCDDKTFGGYWYCVAHGPLAHNFAAAGHSEPSCRVAWWCFGHNTLEVP